MRNWKINSLTKRAARRSQRAALKTKLLHAIAADAGSALVEMALSCVILLSLFIGVFEVCLASYSSHFVAEAAREGARYAIVRGSVSCTNTPALSNCGAGPDVISNYVKGLQYPGIIPSSLLTTWSACGTAPCNVPGNMVNVQVNYAFGLYVPFVPSNSLNINSTSQMVIQQ